jgi:hypothetical protein
LVTAPRVPFLGCFAPQIASRGLPNVYRIISLILFVIGVQSLASASGVPEIDPASAGSAIALLAAAVVFIRGRRR